MVLVEKWYSQLIVTIGYKINQWGRSQISSLTDSNGTLKVTSFYKIRNTVE